MPCAPIVSRSRDQKRTGIVGVLVGALDTGVGVVTSITHVDHDGSTMVFSLIQAFLQGGQNCREASKTVVSQSLSDPEPKFGGVRIDTGDSVVVVADRTDGSGTVRSVSVSIDVPSFASFAVLGKVITVSFHGVVLLIGHIGVSLSVPRIDDTHKGLCGVSLRDLIGLDGCNPPGSFFGQLAMKRLDGFRSTSTSEATQGKDCSFQGNRFDVGVVF